MSTKPCGCPDFERTQEGVSRRAFLSGMLAIGGGLVISETMGLRYAIAATGDVGADVIITISMRGGMDGLMAVPILGDPNLARLRPTISVIDSQALRLDRTFGLHPNLSTFKSLYDAGELAVVHATGTPVGTRSHFDDQNSLELAAYGNPGTATGWQNRYLQATGTTSVLSGLAVSDQMPVAMYGEASTMAFASFDDIFLTDIEADHNTYVDTLKKLHARSDNHWSRQAIETLDAVESLKKIKATASAVVYPETGSAERFKMLASLINAGVPIKTASIDFDGEFDVHSSAGVRGGTMATNFSNLSATIAAFKADLGPRWQRVTIVTLTEFGRRLEENASAGVDHGWASAMFVMGGGVKGGQVITKWPGLAPEELNDGDLAVTTDYRHVLAEVLMNRGGLSSAAISAVLPSFRPMPLDFTRPIDLTKVTPANPVPTRASPTPTPTRASPTPTPTRASPTPTASARPQQKKRVRIHKKKLTKK